MNVLVVVDDEPHMVALVRLLLSADPRLEVDAEAATAQEAIRLVGRTKSDVVILDHFLEGELLGLEAAPLIRAASPGTKILLFSSHDLAVEARREPAVDLFLTKKNVAELLPAVQKLLHLDPAA